MATNQFKKPPIILIGLVLFVVFLRGGYFYYESMACLLIACLVFLYPLWLRPMQEAGWGRPAFSGPIGEKFAIQKGQVLLPFLYCLSYCLPIFWADSMHIYGIFKNLAPLWLALALLFFLPPLDLICQALKAYSLALGLALVLGLLQVVYQDLNLVPVFIKERFTGFLQYANVNAILSLLAGFYAIYGWKKMGFSLICGLSLGLSGSRTGLAVALVLLPAAGLLGLYQNQVRQARVRPYLYRNIVFILGLILGSLALHNTIGPSRLQAGLSASEWQTRLLYYKDGMTLLLNNPKGYGHYGYYLVQRQFQTGSTYLVKYIHNFILQIILDGGLVSGLFFLMMIGQSLFGLVYYGLKEVKSPAPWVGLGFLALLAHAFIDFDFQFTFVVSLFYWAYFYFLGLWPDQAQKRASPGRKVQSTSPKSAWYCKIRASKIGDRSGWIKGFSLILLMVATCLGLVAWQTYQGQYGLGAGLGFTDAKIAILLDSGQKPDYQWAVARSMEENRIKNVETFAFLRNYYYNKGKLKMAIKYGQVAVDLAPLWIEHRQELMRVEYAYALKYPQDIDLVAGDILSVVEELADLKKSRSSQLKVRHKPSWELTADMRTWYQHFQNLYRILKE